MPNRIIKESICTSEKINGLSDFHFRLWACLITYVDDFGRGDARSAIIKGRCFPLRERVTVKDIDAGLHVLADTGCIILYTVDGESYLCFPNWDKHQTIRNQKSKYPAPPKDVDSLKAIESNCKQLEANVPVIQSNPNPNPNPNPYPNPMMDDATAAEIQHDHDRVLTAAEDAGFKMSNTVRARLIALFADNGLEKMLSGFNECATHGAPTLAYLEAVLKGTGKKKPQMKVLPAQQYGQRDYSGVQAELMAEQDREMEEYMKKESG